MTTTSIRVNHFTHIPQSLEQLSHLKKSAAEYLSQCYQLSPLLKGLLEELKAFPNSRPGLQLDNFTKDLEMLLESFQIGIEEAHNAIDFGINPHPTFLSLNVDQTQISTLLREATKSLAQLKHILIEAAYELDTYDGFETYTQELETVLSNKKEVSHG